MYCSRCGQALVSGQPICSRCGQNVSVAAPAPFPGIEHELAAYAGKIKLLSTFWLVYAVLSLALGFFGLSVARAFFSGALPWLNNPMQGDMPSTGMMGFFFHLAWIAIVIRTALAAVAAWGLWERTSWGRIVAIVAGFLSLLKFPIGTALGIWTLIVLMGQRNGMLYEQNSIHRL